MEKAPLSPRTVRFGAFELDLATAELRKHGSRVRIQEQPFKVLAALLERPGEVVPREELVRLLWPDGTFVDFDRGLNAAVTRLRQALADSAENPRYVETLARRGYRFLSQVETVSSSTPAEVDAGSRRLKISSVHRNWWIALASAVLLLLIVTMALVIPRKQRETRFEQITRDPGLATDPAVSPDGKLLAYASDRGAQNLNVWVRQLAPGGKAVQLTHEDSDAHQPWFSPDGTTIVYRSERDGGGLYVIPSIGGEPKRIVA
ncbi:MAG: winged helix-turn-helix domain-containing protein [Acidobacteriota bacterium]|nr:winged helix-turn-helix domain-containing protein [Acidobacteriota bacterium]